MPKSFFLISKYKVEILEHIYIAVCIYIYSNISTFYFYLLLYEKIILDRSHVNAHQRTSIMKEAINNQIGS